MTLLVALLLAFLVFLITATLVLFIIGPTMLLQPRRRGADFYRSLGEPVNPEEARLPAEEFEITTGDGLHLSCWLMKADAPARGTIIYLHGVADCKIDGLHFAEVMHRHHFNVFLYDARRHGKSEGKYCTYGYYEKNDVRCIIDYLYNRSDFQPGKIGLFGTSMGAAVALQAAAIDTRIAGVAAENSFATLRTIFDDYQRRLIRLPFHYLRNLVIVRAEFQANFRASDVSPLDSIGQIHIPVLIIYGKNDELIKCQYSQQLVERANEPKEAYPVERGTHNDIWKVAGTTYDKKLVDFFERALH